MSFDPFGNPIPSPPPPPPQPSQPWGQQPPQPPQPPQPWGPQPVQPWQQQPFGQSTAIPSLDQMTVTVPGSTSTRPRATVGAVLLIVGAIVHGVASVLPWYSVEGATANGFDTWFDEDFNSIENPGTVWVVMGVVLLGLGLATLFAGRRLAIAIVAVVFSVIACFFSLVGVAVTSDTKDFLGLGGPSIGVFAGIAGALVALAGSIVILATRRR